MSELAPSPFIAKLLAPIAAEEEQADTLEHGRAMRADARQALRKAEQRWIIAMDKVRVAEAAHTIARAAFESSGERYVTDATPFAIRAQRAWGDRILAEEAQCLIPAPTAKELRWKKRVVGHRSNLPEKVVAVIAADEARLCPK